MYFLPGLVKQGTWEGHHWLNAVGGWMFSIFAILCLLGFTDHFFAKALHALYVQGKHEARVRNSGAASGVELSDSKRKQNSPEVLKVCPRDCCNQYKPECDRKSAIRIRAKFRA